MQLGKAKALAAMSLLSVLVMILAACSGTTSNGPTPLAHSQQIFQWHLTPNAIDINTMDPSLVTDFYSQQAVMLEDPLLYVYDTNLNYTPWAADGMPQISNGGKTYTIKIKPGLKWSDGTPITADTYAYSINRTMDPCTQGGTPAGGAFFTNALLGAAAFTGSSCTSSSSAFNPVDARSLIGQNKALFAQDPLTLVINLAAPYAYFLGDLTTSGFSAMPEQLITKYGYKDWTNHLTDGSGFGGGTFNLTGWTHQGLMVFKANQAEQQILDGTTSKLSEIDVAVYKDKTTQFADFRNGRQDTGFPASTDYQESKTLPNFHEIPFLDVSYLGTNWSKPPFNNVLARRAFDVAINRNAVVRVLKDEWIPSCHLIPQGSLGYNPNLACPEAVSLDGDPNMAKQLIDQYAAANCPGGQVSKCPPVTYWDDNQQDALATDAVLKAEWTQALDGYPFIVKNVDFNTLLNTVFSGNPPQIFALGYAVDYNDAQDWTSLQFTPGASTNTGYVNDPAATTLFSAADVDQDQADRIAKYQQAEQILVNDGAWMPLYQERVVYNTAKRVQGFTETATGYPAPHTFDVMYLTNAS